MIFLLTKSKFYSKKKKKIYEKKNFSIEKKKKTICLCVTVQNLSLADLQRHLSPWHSWYVPSIVWRSPSTGSVGSDKDTSSPDSKDFFSCQDCGRIYKLKSSLRNHRKWECGKEPQFQCPYCSYRAKQKMHVARHIERVHKDKIERKYDVKNEG